MKTFDAIITGLLMLISALYLCAYTMQPEPAFLIGAAGFFAVGFLKGFFSVGGAR
jgi:hypothetical protein